MLDAVFNRSGKPLGLIGLPGVCNLGFAGENLNKLYILNDESVHMIELQVITTQFLFEFEQCAFFVVKICKRRIS